MRLGHIGDEKDWHMEMRAPRKGRPETMSNPCFPGIGAEFDVGAEILLSGLSL